MTVEIHVCRPDAKECLGCGAPPILTAIRREQGTAGSPPVDLCHRCFGSWALGAMHPAEQAGSDGFDLLPAANQR